MESDPEPNDGSSTPAEDKPPVTAKTEPGQSGSYRLLEHTEPGQSGSYLVGATGAALGIGALLGALAALLWCKCNCSKGR